MIEVKNIKKSFADKIVINDVSATMKAGQCIPAIDARYFRPAEVETLLGDPRRAREKLGWVPTTTFESLVAEMMQADLVLARRDALVIGAGYRAPKNHE